jgi:hypothetical protein
MLSKQSFIVSIRFLVEPTPKTFRHHPVLNLYGAMAILAPGLIFLLVRAKRFTDAFIIALPMIYALASLGILYVERRYVRYAGLTHLLAFQILFSDLTKVFLRSIGDRFRIGQQQF